MDLEKIGKKTNKQRQERLIVFLLEKEAKKKKKKAMLLFPDMKDAMTLKPIKEPALSPTGKIEKKERKKDLLCLFLGYVLEYRTWLKVLNNEPKNTCPFTKQKVTRRDLVKLTVDNVEVCLFVCLFVGLILY